MTANNQSPTQTHSRPQTPSLCGALPPELPAASDSTAQLSSAEPASANPELLDLSAFQPTSPTNTLGWDLRPVRITRYGPDQRGTLREYSSNARSNPNPPLLGLAGLLLGIDIVPAGADQPHGGRLYLSIDLQGLLPEQINQLRLRIGIGPKDRNWPVRTALYGLLAGNFRYGDPVGLSTRAGHAIYFLEVLRSSGRAVVPPRGYWHSNEAIGHRPLDLLLAINNLRRRLSQPDLGPEVFGDLLEQTEEWSRAGQRAEDTAEASHHRAPSKPSIPASVA